jgi:hypothetical protein
MEGDWEEGVGVALGGNQDAGCPPRREALGKGRQSERLAFQHVGKGWEEGVGVPGGGRSGRTGKGVLGRVSGWQSERLVFQHVTTDWEEGCQGCLAAGRGAGKKLGKGVGGVRLGEEIDRLEY